MLGGAMIATITVAVVAATVALIALLSGPGIGRKFWAFMAGLTWYQLRNVDKLLKEATDQLDFMKLSYIKPKRLETVSQGAVEHVVETCWLKWQAAAVTPAYRTVLQNLQVAKPAAALQAWCSRISQTNEAVDAVWLEICRILRDEPDADADSWMLARKACCRAVVQSCWVHWAHDSDPSQALMQAFHLLEDTVPKELLKRLCLTLGTRKGALPDGCWSAAVGMLRGPAECPATCATDVLWGSWTIWMSTHLQVSEPQEQACCLAAEKQHVATTKLLTSLLKHNWNKYGFKHLVKHLCSHIQKMDGEACLDILPVCTQASRVQEHCSYNQLCDLAYKLNAQSPVHHWQVLHALLLVVEPEQYVSTLSGGGGNLPNVAKALIVTDHLVVILESLPEHTGSDQVFQCAVSVWLVLACKVRPDRKAGWKLSHRLIDRAQAYFCKVGRDVNNDLHGKWKGLVASYDGKRE